MPPRRVTIRDHTAEANLFARRAVIAAVMATLLLLLLVTNLYYLQVTKFSDYQTRSNGNRIKVIPVAPNRGLIYDRNGVLLAENRPVYSLTAIPEKLEDKDKLLQQLKSLVNLSDEEIEEFNEEIKRQRRFKPLTLKSQLTDEERARFAVNRHKFPGFHVEARLKRFYPFADTLTHTLGYVAKLNKNDAAQIDSQGQTANYAATYDIGKQGIEKFYESQLHGTVGYEEVEVNNRGRVLRSLRFEKPIPGENLILNLDIELQMVAQKALEGHRGALVAMDPRDGGIIALYSNPSYDPNLFVHGISSKNYSKLLNSQDRPLINRTTQGRYPPASTVKPLMGLIGLEEEVITVDTSIKDRGFFRLKGLDKKWRDWQSWGHGEVNLNKAIAQSCDTYFWHMASKLNIDAITDMAGQFGFGDSTGIDIHEESSAILPSRGWKRARMGEPWYGGDTLNIGIGQGYWNVTPIQLANSIAILVNRGKHYVPQLLRGKGLEDNIVPQPKVERRPVVLKNPENWEPILNGMHTTVKDKIGGAFKVFRGTKYDSAGKTGTAQVISIAEDEEYDAEKIDERHRDNAMYVGFAPFTSPEIVVVVALENAGGGGKNAAPIARQILDHYFKENELNASYK